MLVDIGEGVTDIAVICSGTVLTSSAVRTACSDMHSALRRQVAEVHGTLLYRREAERLTRAVGVVRRDPPPATFTASGKNRRTGRKVEILLSDREIVDAIDPVVSAIVRAVQKTVEDLPLTTSCEVIESGICLSGGGARLPGLARLIAAETSLDVRPAPDPLRAVIDGARQMLTVARNTGLWAS
jgi:rod shape-determining protein MreB